MSKKFAPIFITILICLFGILQLLGITYLVIVSTNTMFRIFGVIFDIVIIWIIIALIVNLVRRLKEIKEEKEDDLSKY